MSRNHSSSKATKTTASFHLEVEVSLNARLRARARSCHKPIAWIVRQALAQYLGANIRSFRRSSPEQVVAGDVARLLQVCVAAVNYVWLARDKLLARDLSQDSTGAQTAAIVAAIDRIDTLALEIRRLRRQMALHLGDLPRAKPIPRTCNRDMPQPSEREQEEKAP